MKSRFLMANAFLAASVLSAVPVAQADDLTLCWAACDPANA